MRDRDGVVILWQAEQLCAWISAAPAGAETPSVEAYLASMWESVCELIPAGLDVLRHRAVADWSTEPVVAEWLQLLGVELVHVPGCTESAANYFLAVDALGLVAMKVQPERLIVVGCNSSSLPLLRAVHSAGLPVAAVALALPDRELASWSFTVEPVVSIEHPSAATDDGWEPGLAPVEKEDHSFNEGVPPRTGRVLASFGADSWTEGDTYDEEFESACAHHMAELAYGEFIAADEAANRAAAQAEVESRAEHPARRAPSIRTVITERLPMQDAALPTSAPEMADLSNPANVAKLLVLGTGRAWTEGHSLKNSPRVVTTVLEWIDKTGALPLSTPSVKEFRAEFEQLDKHARNAGLLGELSKPAHLAVLGWLVNRVRHLQEVAHGLPAEETERLNGVMGMLSQHSRDQQPGYLNGLKRAHEPERGSWNEDALFWAAKAKTELGWRATTAMERTHGAEAKESWNRDNSYRELFALVRADAPPEAELILGKVRILLAHGVPPNDKRLVHAMLDFDHLLGGAEFTRLLASVRDERAEREREAREEEVTEVRLVPPDWAGFAFTKGMRVAIIGGDERPERRERLRVEFGFGELEWIETSPNAGVARVHDLAQRMKNGSLDLVVVLQAWVSHKITDIVFGTGAPACEVVLSATYGVTQVQRAVERYLLGIRHD